MVFWRNSKSAGDDLPQINKKMEMESRAEEKKVNSLCVSLNE